MARDCLALNHVGSSLYISNIWHYGITLLLRDAMLARCMMSSCVRLSVTRRYCIVPAKRPNLGSRKQHRTIA